MLVIGGWNAPSCLMQLSACVTYLHNLHPNSTTGEYMENCDQCVELNHIMEINKAYDANSVFGKEHTQSDFEHAFFSSIRKGLGLFKSCKRHAMKPNLLCKG